MTNKGFRQYLLILPLNYAYAASPRVEEDDLQKLQGDESHVAKQAAIHAFLLQESKTPL